MNYTFPIINTIDDVLPAIEGDKNFIVAEKDGYTVINYILAGNDTFPDIDSHPHAAMRRECRGLVFYPNGEIMSRPFHKFFNLGEREETQPNNLPTNVLSIQPKLDGSMIRPLFVNGYLRLGTKMGITNVSMQAEEFIADKPNYLQFMDDFMKSDFTPIFEWCSRKQRIVLDYPEDSLVLLAARNIWSGKYYDTGTLSGRALTYGIPTNLARIDSIPILNLRDKVSATELEEGVVVTYPSGHKLKIKSDWYVKLHKAKEKIQQEKDILLYILDGTIDDIKPSLLPEDLTKIENFEQEIQDNIKEVSHKIQHLYLSVLSLWSDRRPPRKEFALAVFKETPTKYHRFMFLMYDGKFTMETLVGSIKKICSSSTTLEENRWMINGAKYDKS